jgi:hypothetical protein
VDVERSLALILEGKKLGTTLSIWIYCKPLKFLKTAKAIFGNVWTKQAEIWKSLEKIWRPKARIVASYS